MREPTEHLNWVAEAIDVRAAQHYHTSSSLSLTPVPLSPYTQTDGEGRIKYSSFSHAMVQAEMEDGLMKPDLRAALETIDGRGPPWRQHKAEFGAHSGGGPAAFPQAPSALRGGAAALSSKYAWSEWGGVPKPDAPLQAVMNPDDAAKLEQANRATNNPRPGAAQRLEERAAARKRHKVQVVLDTLRHQVEMHGSVAAAFRKLEVSKDANISSDELQIALKRRFNIDMSEETTKGVIKEFDVSGHAPHAQSLSPSCLLACSLVCADL